MEAEVQREEEEISPLRKVWQSSPVLIIVGALLIASAGTAVLFGDEILAWIEGEPEYDLIDFDPAWFIDTILE